MSRKGPIPPEHMKIAKGAGAAAILMFLHIATVGYLGFVAYWLLKHGPTLDWTFARLPAAMAYWLPVFFALITMLPTDKLTKTVAITARSVGFAVMLLCTFGAYRAVQAAGDEWHAGIIAILACAAGLAAALAIRAVFAALMAQARENYKKNASENEVVE